jgi:exodeoxyribonuclease VII small subunit
MSAKNNMTVAEKTAKLNELAAWFNSDDFELEQALEKFTRAEELAAEIEKDLVALKNRIEVVKEKFESAA